MINVLVNCTVLQKFVAQNEQNISVAL